MTLFALEEKRKGHFEINKGTLGRLRGAPGSSISDDE